MKKEEKFRNYLLKEAEKLDCWWMPDWIEKKWENFNEEETLEM